MLGFEIKVNEEEIRRVASDGILTVFIFFGTSPADFKVKHPDEMALCALSSDGYNLTWKGRELKLGDRIRISVADIRNIDSEEKRERSMSDLLETYNNIKAELESEGVI